MRFIFKSKLLEKLLIYAFSHPEDTYYVRELSHYIDEDSGNLSRELRKLGQEGLFTSTQPSKNRYYRLNKSYPMYKEVKTFIEATDRFLREAEKISSDKKDRPGE